MHGVESSRGADGVAVLPKRGAMANNHDIPELMPVPEQLQVFDVYRMRVRFEDDPTKSRNHYVAAIVI